MTDGLLLVHAFPLDARMWEPQLTTFADALPVVAPHLPASADRRPPARR
jgi:pimeloyl-ACP methyl ester carboxylesterase